ncbi:BACON domain-containing carbohydrate-binding protein [uncultured Alistipes sp.]|uniref:BACON domain-containing protein n=1 Tax=uncultured Alistipes sp. TaxID=538949 RepID=UPI002624781B|nr:BACON domain-containing carbohydrate-binding protein [uncultured Alistipes sp.]
MAKPQWVTTQPSSGSNNGTVNVSGGKHTGRTQRSGNITFKASGAADVERPVNQAGRAEFVTVNNVSAPKSGGNVTITGKSNSSKLNFELGAGDITVTLPENYSAGGASTKNNVAIAGDPGAGAEFEFSITLAIPKNTTVTAKSRKITITAAGGQTTTSTISQAAGDPTLSVTPESISLDAEGTAVAVTVTSNTNWTVE